MTECNKNPFPKKQVQVVKKTPKPIFNFSCKMITKPGPALPLGELGNCLRPPSGRGPQNFRKEPTG